MNLARNNMVVSLNQEAPLTYALLNPVAGNFDLMSPEEYKLYQEAEQGRYPNEAFTEYLLERGYLYETETQEREARDKAYQAFQQEAQAGQVQLMLIPTYSCNLNCTYCFQQGIDGKPTLISLETVDGFFDYARKKFGHLDTKPFITLFGGEPLMDSRAHRQVLERIVQRCGEEGYALSAVTNGYDFEAYAPLLSQVEIKEIQFTLDGEQKIHDQRRMTANGKGTFDRILAGIEKAVSLGMPVNLRSVVDKENIEALVPMAEILDQKGWLDLPPEKFKTQIGRNYELFECYAKPEHLYDQIELWGAVANLARTYPVMKKYHRPDFMGIRYLVDTGEMYLASFDTCPAAKTEWVFDLNGDIYGCTASCGREEFRLGTYWPHIDEDLDAIEKWQTRDVTRIEKCKSCKYDVICGGGCGVVAANHHQGDILSPDCRPVQGMYEIGLNFYRKEIDQMAASQEEVQNGCMICGQELNYLETPVQGTCAICGKEMNSNIICPEGHMVCDDCHNGDALNQMENLLIHSVEQNPMKLAEQVFKLPSMKLHGPEHHSMVPGVLEAAWQNIQGIRDPAKIKETMRRGKEIKGGSCGYLGNCGACVGAGIAESVFSQAKPSSNQERGKSMEATAQALMAVSEAGGPLCCKRDSMTAIRSYMDFSGRYKGVQPYEFVCTYSKFNPGCLKKRCPYFPSGKQGGETDNLNQGGVQ